MTVPISHDAEAQGWQMSGLRSHSKPEGLGPPSLDSKALVLPGPDFLSGLEPSPVLPSWGILSFLGREGRVGDGPGLQLSSGRQCAPHASASRLALWAVFFSNCSFFSVAVKRPPSAEKGECCVVVFALLLFFNSLSKMSRLLGAGRGTPSHSASQSSLSWPEPWLSLSS